MLSATQFDIRNVHFRSPENNWHDPTHEDLKGKISQEAWTKF